eukprot:9675507-Alexandrium_andersonii.AAC.1
MIGVSTAMPPLCWLVPLTWHAANPVSLHLRACRSCVATPPGHFALVLPRSRAPVRFTFNLAAQRSH